MVCKVDDIGQAQVRETLSTVVHDDVSGSYDRWKLFCGSVVCTGLFLFINVSDVTASDHVILLPVGLTYYVI